MAEALCIALTIDHDGNLSATVDGNTIDIDESAKELFSKLAFCVSILDNRRVPYSLTVMR